MAAITECKEQPPQAIQQSESAVISETIYSRKGLPVIKKLAKQLAMALNDVSGREKYEASPFEVLISPDLPGHPVEYPRFSSAHAQLIGSRRIQEDRFLSPVEISFSCKSGDVKGLLTAVFDGHCDQGTVGDYLREQLADKLSTILSKNCSEIDLPSDEIVTNACTLAFHELTEECHAKEIGFGATAVCALILGDRVFCPNVGDSRMILVTPESSYQLSEDASMQNPRFQKWHQRHGNRLIKIHGEIRVGQLGLNVGRDVGMRRMCSRPKITRFFIGEEESSLAEGRLYAKKGENLLILSSDGLSHSATVEEVGREVRKLSKAGATLQQIADALATRATQCADSDNVTVMVLAI